MVSDAPERFGATGARFLERNIERVRKIDIEDDPSGRQM
jgi:hypothetical protein